MEREIKFRGKRADTGEWVCGNLIKIASEWDIAIINNDEKVVHPKSNGQYCENHKRYLLNAIQKFDNFGNIFDYEIIPETVGQFTGLSDKNGKEIFEGDIVSAWSDGCNHKGEIRWRFEGQPSIIIYPAFGNQGFWKLHGQGTGDAFDGGKIDDGVEIIGNIHDNRELLK